MVYTNATLLLARIEAAIALAALGFKADDSESPCDRLYWLALCEPAMQTQYWVAVASFTKAEAGFGEASTDGSMSDACWAGTMMAPSVLRRVGAPKIFVMLNIEMAVKIRADFILTSLQNTKSISDRGLLNP